MGGTLDGTNAHYRKLRKTASQVEGGKPVNGMASRQLSMNRPPSYAPSLSGFSNRSNDHDHMIPPPSTPKEKSKHIRFATERNIISIIKKLIPLSSILCRRYFATVFAVMWAVFLVVWAIVIFIADAVFNLYPLMQVC